MFIIPGGDKKRKEIRLGSFETGGKNGDPDTAWVPKGRLWHVKRTQWLTKKRGEKIPNRLGRWNTSRGVWWRGERGGD